MNQRLWLIALVVTAAACTEVPGVGCESDSAFPGSGVCLDGICFENTCTPECGIGEQCIRTECVAAFTGVRIESPVAGKLAGSEIAVTAVLDQVEGVTAEAPAQLLLTAVDDSGARLEAHLAKLPDTLRYEGRLAPARQGSFKLQVSSPELGLSSPEVEVTLAWCPGGCAASKTCKVTGCESSFTSIELLSPSADATVGARVDIRARLVRAAESDGVAPDKLELIAGTESVELGYGSADEYSGLWEPRQAGSYSLQVTSPALALTSEAISVVVDKSAPAFSIRVLSPPPRADHELEPDPAFRSAHRRDENAVVEISSSDHDVDSKSIRLAVVGTSGEPKLFPTEIASSCESGDALCWTASVPLGDPDLKLDAFRGEFTVTATGSDVLGNESDPVSTSIKVTRWKWAFSANGFIKTSPAIGSRGDIYVAEASNNGKVYAVSPDGTLRWEFKTDGPVTSSIAVGETAGVETVFVAGRYLDAGTSRVGAIWALDGTNPSAQPVCTLGANAEASIGLTYTKLTTEPSPVLTAVGILNQASAGYLVAARPNGGIKCVSATLDSSSGNRTGIAIESSNVYFGDANGRVQAYSLNSTGNCLPLTGWPVNVGAGNAPTNPIITDAGIAGGGGVGVGRLFSIPAAGGSPIHQDTGSPTWNVVMTSDNELVAGTDSGKLLFASDSLQAPPRSTPLVGGIVGAPAIGSDKRLYVATDAGMLYSLDQNGAVEWSVDLSDRSESSPALDCARRSDGSIDSTRPGTLYVGTDGDKLIAVVVDSKGIDVDSPWPKFHRDPRNSGDASVDLRRFECK